MLGKEQSTKGFSSKCSQSNRALIDCDRGSDGVLAQWGAYLSGFSLAEPKEVGMGFVLRTHDPAPPQVFWTSPVRAGYRPCTETMLMPRDTIGGVFSNQFLNAASCLLLDRSSLPRFDCLVNANPRNTQ